MKKRVRSVLAAVVSLGLFLVLTPNLFRDSGFSWIDWDSVTGSRTYYFARRQWLADARTIVAAIQYLYESSTSTPANPTDVVNVPHPPPLRPINTNYLGMAHPGRISTMLPGAPTETMILVRLSFDPVLPRT
jgi:hypothetical protein